MPYIPQEDREKIDPRVEGLYTVIKDQPAGELNYAISKLIWKLFDHKKGYTTACLLVGTLILVIFEFVRRRVNSYEDVKIVENGDITV
ncbi:MAG: DUF6899 family protein [Candidatus Baldrarchaeia archaeon]